VVLAGGQDSPSDNFPGFTNYVQYNFNSDLSGSWGSNYANWNARGSAAMVYFNAISQFVIIGGRDGVNNALSDVWATANPSGSWTQLTDSAAFGVRFSHAAAVLHNQIFVYGGTEGGVQAFNDVWSSADGSAWTLRTDNAAFSPRMNLAATVVQDALLFVIGGGYPDINAAYATPGALHTTVSGGDDTKWYSSTDGVNFQVVSGSALPFDALVYPTVGVAGDKTLVLAGGPQENEVYNTGITNQVFVYEVDMSCNCADKIAPMWTKLAGTSYNMQQLKHVHG